MTREHHGTRPGMEKKISIILAGIMIMGMLLLSSCKKDESAPVGPSGQTSISVTGRAIIYPIIPYYDPPARGLTAMIPGHTAVAVGADGRFTISNVTPPYDLWLIDNGGKKVMIWRGLTRQDPTVRFSTVNIDTTSVYRAKISGNVYPSSAFPANGSLTAWSVTSPLGYANGPVNVLVSPGTIDGEFKWTGQSSVTGTLHVLQVYFDAGGISYPGFIYGERRGVTFQPNGTIAVNDTLVHVETDTLTMSATVPSGYTSVVMYADLLMPDGGIMQMGYQWPTSTSQTCYFPRIGAHAILVANATAPNGSRSRARADVATSSRGVVLDIPPIPSLLLPVLGATGVKIGSRFTWSSQTGSVSILDIWEASAQTPEVSIITPALTDSLPDLSSIGITWPAGTLCNWSVESYGTYSSTDDFATSTGMTRARSWGYSSPRGFTSAP